MKHLAREKKENQLMFINTLSSHWMIHNFQSPSDQIFRPLELRNRNSSVLLAGNTRVVFHSLMQIGMFEVRQSARGGHLKFIRL